ncbi:hypothetical protein T492DRAFT_875873 [Pavlovales sp. CCMP2436]|nr:hypothetical protein T492DRAFT_875873 [Pavlovales sp. CCMP2436]
MGIVTGHEMLYAEGVREGCICNFNVHIAEFDLGKVPQEVLNDLRGIKLEDVVQDLLPQAHFLCSGMLELGCNYVVAYTRTVDEAKLFATALEIIAEKYYGVPMWTGVIYGKMSVRRRARMLRDFQQQTGRLRVLVAVHLMNTAIDVPFCAGVYFLHMVLKWYAAAIRLFKQRVGRASRPVATTRNMQSSSAGTGATATARTAAAGAAGAAVVNSMRKSVRAARGAHV